MARNWEDTVFPGGIVNRINRVTMRHGGNTVSYNGPYPQTTHGGSGINPRTVINRTLTEPPTERPLQDGVKNTDV